MVLARINSAVQPAPPGAHAGLGSGGQFRIDILINLLATKPGLQHAACIIARRQGLRQ